MELTEEVIKQMILKGRINAITLDACIFSANGNQFEQGLLARLEQFNAGSVRFILSDVVHGEVLKHVTEEAVKSQSRVESAFKDIGKSWQISEEQSRAAMAMLFKSEAPENLARRRFDKFSRLTALEIIRSDGHVDIARVLDAYFSSAPPFGSIAAKKYEFPDAIALQALESWAKKHETILLVISKDSDWQKFGKVSDNLVVIDELAHALSYFHQNSDVACARLVVRRRNGELPLDGALQDAVQGVLDRSIVVSRVSSEYLTEAVNSELRLISVTLDEAAHHGGPFRVIDRPSAQAMVVEARVEAEIEVSADLNFFLPNLSDRTRVLVGVGHARTTNKQHFRMLLAFHGDFEKDARLVSVEAGIQRGDVPLHVDFGDVQPNQ